LIFVSVARIFAAGGALIGVMSFCHFDVWHIIGSRV